MRYAQVNALVSSLLLDETFSGMSLPERNAVLKRIQSEIMGRMMEVIVLLDTQHRYGTITSKKVLYRGESKMAGEIRYMNVEEYLKQLCYELNDSF